MNVEPGNYLIKFTVLQTYTHDATEYTIEDTFEVDVVWNDPCYTHSNHDGDWFTFSDNPLTATHKKTKINTDYTSPVAVTSFDMDLDRTMILAFFLEYPSTCTRPLIALENGENSQFSVNIVVGDAWQLVFWYSDSYSEPQTATLVITYPDDADKVIRQDILYVLDDEQVCSGGPDYVPQYWGYFMEANANTFYRADTNSYDWMYLHGSATVERKLYYKYFHSECNSELDQNAFFYSTTGSTDSEPDWGITVTPDWAEVSFTISQLYTGTSTERITLTI